MKAKLQGSIFCYPMDYNEITITEKTIQIHNSNNTGFGYMHSHINENDTKDPLRFTFNKKDYSLLKTLDEFYVELNDDVIIVTAVGFKAKIANMKDIQLIRPNTDKLEDLSIEYTDLLKGKNFAGAPDNVRIQLDGATVLKEGIIMCNGNRSYMKYLKNDKRNEVNIPIESFKYLDSKEDYLIKSDGKLITFMRDSEVFYTTAIAVNLKMLDVSKTPKVMFKVNKANILEKLKVLKPYTDVVHIIAQDNAMELISANEANEIYVKIPITPIKLKVLNISWNVESIIAMLSITYEEEVTIEVMENMIVVRDEKENVCTFTAIIVNQGMEVDGGE